MNRQAPNICFYSNRCQWCKAFITELAQTRWKYDFRFVCVDPSPTRPQLPGWLKKVPTLKIAGEEDPRTDSEVMNWLYEKKMREGDGGGDQGQGQGLGQPRPSDGGEPSAFNVIENSAFAKGFSYSGLNVDTSAQGNGGESMPGSFAFLRGAAAPGDRMSQEMPGGGGQGGMRGGGGGDRGGQRSKKEQLFDKQMEAYQRERERGMPARQAPRG